MRQYASLPNSLPRWQLYRLACNSYLTSTHRLSHLPKPTTPSLLGLLMLVPAAAEFVSRSLGGIEQPCSSSLALAEQIAIHGSPKGKSHLHAFVRPLRTSIKSHASQKCYCIWRLGMGLLKCITKTWQHYTLYFYLTWLIKGCDPKSVLHGPAVS